MSQNPPAKNIDVVASAVELAQIFKDDRNLIEKSEYETGRALVAIFEDPNFKNKDFKNAKIESIKLAIDDISRGAIELKDCSMGVVFRNGRYEHFATPHGKSTEGNVAFSISLKNIVAFKNWREDDGVSVSQDDLNSAIYYLTALLSENI